MPKSNDTSSFKIPVDPFARLRSAIGEANQLINVDHFGMSDGAWYVLLGALTFGTGGVLPLMAGGIGVLSGLGIVMAMSTGMGEMAAGAILWGRHEKAFDGLDAVLGATSNPFALVGGAIGSGLSSDSAKGFQDGVYLGNIAALHVQFANTRAAFLDADSSLIERISESSQLGVGLATQGGPPSINNGTSSASLPEPSQGTETGQSHTPSSVHSSPEASAAGLVIGGGSTVTGPVSALGSASADSQQTESTARIVFEGHPAYSGASPYSSAQAVPPALPTGVPPQVKDLMKDVLRSQEQSGRHDTDPQTSGSPPPPGSKPAFPQAPMGQNPPLQPQPQPDTSPDPGWSTPDYGGGSEPTQPPAPTPPPDPPAANPPSITLKMP